MSSLSDLRIGFKTLGKIQTGDVVSLDVNGNFVISRDSMSTAFSRTWGQQCRDTYLTRLKQFVDAIIQHTDYLLDSWVIRTVLQSPDHKWVSYEQSDLQLKYQVLCDIYEDLSECMEGLIESVKRYKDDKQFAGSFDITITKRIRNHLDTLKKKLIEIKNLSTMKLSFKEEEEVVAPVKKKKKSVEPIVDKKDEKEPEKKDEKKNNT